MKEMSERQVVIAQAEANLEHSREQLRNLREQVKELIEEQRLLREQRVAAIRDGFWERSRELHEQIRAIGERIKSVNHGAQEQVRLSKETLAEVLDHG